MQQLPPESKEQLRELQKDVEKAKGRRDLYLQGILVGMGYDPNNVEVDINRGVVREQDEGEG